MEFLSLNFGLFSSDSPRATYQFLNQFLDSKNVLHHLQSGNRKLHLTESTLLHLTDKLFDNMGQRKVSVIVLLDMSKAFDSIRTTYCYVKFAKLVYLNLRAPGSKAICLNVNKC